MASPTHAQRILRALASANRPLNDDELSQHLKIHPRQTVNQICRNLEKQGLLLRQAGPDGKIVNVLRAESPSAPMAAAVHGEAPSGTTTAQVDAIRPLERPPGSSQEQRDAERDMLDLLGDQLGLALDPMTIAIPSGARVEVDGADVQKTVLVECWAHIGPPKAAQRHKVLSDAFKLVWISSTLYPRPRLILCLADEAAAAPFRPSSRSWAGRALKDLNIEVIVVAIPKDLRETLENAQRRQYR